MTLRSQAKFVVKTDDDQYIDLYEVLVLTASYSESPHYMRDRFLLCPVWRGMPIMVRQLINSHLDWSDFSQRDINS